MAEQPSDNTPGSGYTNNAAEGSNVGAQIGFVRGNFYQFNTSDDTPPQEKYEIALRYLSASAGRHAARLIKELIDTGFTGNAVYSVNHISYHWIMAILSGRSFDQLSDEDFADIQMARGLANLGLPSQWLDAFNVVCKLLDAMRRQEQTGRADPVLDTLYDDYRALVDECRDEFRRHLDPLLAGALADSLEKQIAREAEGERMSHDREKRAWKFFEPNPEPPRRRVAIEPTLELGQRLVFGAAAIVSIAAVGLAVALLQTGGAVRAAIVAAAVVLSSALAARAWLAYVVARELVAAKDRDYGSPHRLNRYSAPAPDEHSDVIDDGDGATTLQARRERIRRRIFVRAVKDHIDDQFNRRAPRSPSARRSWGRATAGIKPALVRQILSLYDEPSLALGAVDWLVNWRVKEIARKWRSGELYTYRDQLRPGVGTSLTAIVATIVSCTAAGYTVIVIAGIQPGVTVIEVLAILTSAMLAVLSKVDVHLVEKRLAAAEQKDYDGMYREDEREYLRWTDVLADSPGDDEIARWLDYDKIHFKSLAMSQLGLARRDVLAYATLTEPAPGSIGMRAPFAPRYSMYIVTVFLVTESGVRQVSVTLNFITGDAFDQVRRSFRHEAIASATVLETGIRFGAGRREPMSAKSAWDRGQAAAIPTRQQARGHSTGTQLILRQRLLLGLANGQFINFVVENFDAAGLDEAAGDAATLLNFALDTSGIQDALELLEAISGHGAKWVARRLRARRPGGGVPR